MEAVRSSITEWHSWTGQDPASMYTDPASGTAVLDRDLWAPVLWPLPFLVLLERVTFTRWG